MNSAPFIKYNKGLIRVRVKLKRNILAEINNKSKEINRIFKRLDANFSKLRNK